MLNTHSLFRSFFFLLGSFCSGILYAQNYSEIQKDLAKRMPELGPITSVKPTSYKGLLEVIAGGEIFYATEDGRAMISGQLYDTIERTNVTRSRSEEINAVAWDDLPLQHAIKVTYGNGTRKLAIFEDPHCGYCKQLEQTLSKMKDVTIYVMLYPILSSDSSVLSKNIWCAKDKSKAWQDWILNDVNPPNADKSCKPPIQALLDFGKEKRITSTPTMYFANGTRVAGAIPKEALEAKLAEKRNPG